MTDQNPSPQSVVVPVEPTEAMKTGARVAVRRALEAGQISRAEECERCGEPNRACSDGRSYLHAHHHDYARPLDVEWICALCHRAETPLPEKPGAPSKGSKNGSSKLSEADVTALRASPLGCRQLARTYGVDKKTIQRARNGSLWNHI